MIGMDREVVDSIFLGGGGGGGMCCYDRQNQLVLAMIAMP